VPRQNEISSCPCEVSERSESKFGKKRAVAQKCTRVGAVWKSMEKHHLGEGRTPPSKNLTRKETRKMGRRGGHNVIKEEFHRGIENKTIRTEGYEEETLWLQEKAKRKKNEGERLGQPRNNNAQNKKKKKK